MSEKSLSRRVSRRVFLKMVAALGALGVLAGVSNSPVEATPVVGVDLAKPGEDETVIFPGLDKIIKTGHIDSPFVPYFLTPGGKWSDYGVIIDERED